MPNLSLKYNQNFRKNNLVEDMFEDIESGKKGDDNILSLNSRNSATVKDNKEKKTTDKKRYLLFSLFFGLIIFFAIFVLLVLSNHNKALVLDFYNIMEV